MSFFSKFINTEKSASTKEQKQIDKKLKQLNSARYNNKKVLSAVEIQNSYFGDGVLVKDSTTDNVCSCFSGEDLRKIRSNNGGML